MCAVVVSSAAFVLGILVILLTLLLAWVVRRSKTQLLAMQGSIHAPNTLAHPSNELPSL